MTYDWFATILSQSSPALLAPSVAHRLCSLPPLAIQLLVHCLCTTAAPVISPGHFSIARDVPFHTSASQSLVSSPPGALCPASTIQPHGHTLDFVITNYCNPLES